VFGGTWLIRPAKVETVADRNIYRDAIQSERFSPGIHAILEAAGFQVRGTRADCPSCEGRGKLTVAIHGELFFCHRCHRGGSVRQLARSQGLNVPRARVRKGNGPKLAFRAWLSGKMAEMADRERRLARRAEWAKAALVHSPDSEPAWAALADWHHAERQFQTFWQSATDNTGRYWLYRQWRKHCAKR
jgi:hypothetical protein